MAPRDSPSRSLAELEPLATYDEPVTSFESVSTWQQDVPSSRSGLRQHLLAELARNVVKLSSNRLRVAIDGLTAAGKTTLGHELAAEIRVLGRSTARASLDDFKHPWRHARQHGYDRVSGQGYYKNAYDFSAARDALVRAHEPGAGGGCVGGEVVELAVVESDGAFVR